MTGAGRPPIGPTIKTKFPIELLQLIDKFADQFAMTRSDAIRALVIAGLDHQKIDQVLDDLLG